MRIMNTGKKTILCYLLVLVTFWSNTRSHAQQTGSVGDIYSFIHSEFNAIQFYDRDAMESFFKKWKDAETKRISILHMGDSHIQPDILTGVFRNKMQELLGKGGHGLMFPFSIAKTYSSIAYSSNHFGQWTSSRSIERTPKYDLGVLGATCRTYDAYAGFIFHYAKEFPPHYTVLKVFCKKGPQSFDFILDDGNSEQLIKVNNPNNSQPYILVNVSPYLKTISLKVVKSDTGQSEFEFYGMSLESEDNSGCIVHTAGIGGAQFGAPLYQTYFKEQLPSLNPDLVILDYGTNDFLYDDKIKPGLEVEIVNIIRQIREVSPEASIILTSTQDMARRGKRVRSSIEFSALIKKIAREQHCGIFDWFWTSGGLGSIKLWQQNGIAQNDLIHLNTKGYNLKGEMLYEAFLRTNQFLQEFPDSNSFILSLDSFKSINEIPVLIPVINGADSIKKLLTPPVKKKIPANTKTLKHKVKSGQTLSGIASKYGVTVKQIQQWNHIKGTRIRAGQVLIIKKR